VEQSAIGEILHLYDFLPIWQLQTFVDAVALHFASFYSPLLKSPIPFLFFFGEHLAGFRRLSFSFYFHLSD